MRRHLPVLLVLALTQITGWGAVGILPVTAPAVAASFGAPVFAGTSVMFVAMGLAAPFAGRAFRRIGPRRAMAVGAGGIAAGLLLLALSPALPVFWGAWGVIGVAGSLFLTIAAYAYVADHAEDEARGLIGTLMLATGLAGSVFWPVTAFLEHLVGWRGVGAAYAALMFFVVCPLAWFGLPATACERASTAAAPVPGPGLRKGPVFLLLASAIALNSFVTFGIDAMGIQLLQALGMDLAGAVATASLLGIFKVGGRMVDVGINIGGGRKWDGLSTGLVAGAMIPLGLAALWLGGTGIASVAFYLALFGLGSGAFAVARATMPLVFFRKADYAAAMATIALPMNLIVALAAPLLAGLMERAGPQATFALLGGLSLAALALLVVLNGLREKAAPAA